MARKSQSTIWMRMVSWMGWMGHESCARVLVTRLLWRRGARDSRHRERRLHDRLDDERVCRGGMVEQVGPRRAEDGAVVLLDGEGLGVGDVQCRAAARGVGRVRCHVGSLGRLACVASPPGSLFMRFQATVCCFLGGCELAASVAE